MTDSAPLFTVLSGHPDDTELAALNKALTDLVRASSGPQVPERDDWGRPSRPDIAVVGFNPCAFTTALYR